MKKIVSIFLALFFLASCGSYQSTSDSTAGNSGSVSEIGSQNVTAQRIPNDTYFFPNQWGMHNTGEYAYGYLDADIDAPEAWNITTGNPNLVIAVIDTGIDYNHSDFVGNIWTNDDENCLDGIDNDDNNYIDDCKGWNFVSGNNDPMDDNGHGTHVAGIVGAHGDNGEGVTGVMWRVKLMPLKIFSAEGVAASDAQIAAAIRYAVDNGAKVINASWGGPGYSHEIYDAIDYADTHGVIFVASAGNGMEDGLGGVDYVGDNNDLFPHYPASYDLSNIISVAATDQRDERVPFSNYGPNTVDVAAPGVYIWSTIPNWMSTFPDYGRLETYEGTSMAAPHVAGLVGLLISYHDGLQNTEFTPSQVRDTILRYVDWKPSLNDWISTRGRINAHRAVSAILIPTDLTAAANPFEIPKDPSLPPDSIADSPGITLTWTDNATGEDGYKIERDSGSGFEEIDDIGADSTSYTDDGLDPVTSYTYRIRAYNNIDNSFYSDDATAETLSDGEGVQHGSGGCSITAGKHSGTVDLLIMLLPVAAILTLIKRRKR